MANWHVSFTLTAEDDLERLDNGLQKRVIEKLNWLQNNFNNIIPMALTGEWQGFFKLRISDWRIIYQVEWDRNLIIVYIIDRRDKIYKRL